MWKLSGICGKLDGVVAVGMTNPIHVYTFININSYRNQQRADQ